MFTILCLNDAITGEMLKYIAKERDYVEKIRIFWSTELLMNISVSKLAILVEGDPKAPFFDSYYTKV